MSIVGVLDLAGGAFHQPRRRADLTTFRTMLTAGRNGGSWNGTNASGAIKLLTPIDIALHDGVGYGLGSQIGPDLERPVQHRGRRHAASVTRLTATPT
jgi:hypothetical protein